MIRIGVLAFQGAFREHINMLNGCGAEALPVRSGPLGAFDGLVLPGGESTVIGHHLQEAGLDAEIRGLASEGMPILATCAGAILMARSVEGAVPRGGIRIVPLSAKRNGYGSQSDSFRADLLLSGEDAALPGVFIRAPRFQDPGEGVETLARLEDEPVAFRWRNVLLTSFHPELTGDRRIHGRFLRLAA